MLQTLIQVKLIAMAAALGLNTDEWKSPSSDMTSQVQALQDTMKLIGTKDADKVGTNLQESISKIKDLADKGDKDAQYAIAFFIQNGLLQSQNAVPLVFDYYTKAAAQGQVPAKNALGFLKISQANQLPEKDRTEVWKSGVQLIQEASSSGYNPARRNMAELELTGQAGVKQDLDSAHKLLEDAAKAGDNQAEFELFRYFHGRAGKDKVNEAMAQKWLEASADHGNAQGLDTLGTAMLTGAKVGALDIKKDEAGAVQKFKKLADENNPIGLRKMALIELAGLAGQPKDYAKGVEDLQKAARGNDGEAQFRLAGLYDQGWAPEGKGVVPQNDAAALNLYKLAMQNSIAMAAYNVGVFYEQGRSVDKDPTKAFAYYLQAAGNNFVPAMLKAGLAYSNGAGTMKDLIAAAGWFQRSGALGLAEGSLALGMMLEQGAGPLEKEQNRYVQAGYAYTQAAENPNASDGVVAEALVRLGGLDFSGATTISPQTPSPQPDYVKAYACFQQAADLAPKSDLAKQLLDRAKEKLSSEQLTRAKAQADAAKESRDARRKKAQADANATPTAAPDSAPPAPTTGAPKTPKKTR